MGELETRGDQKSVRGLQETTIRMLGECGGSVFEIEGALGIADPRAAAPAGEAPSDVRGMAAMIEGVVLELRDRLQRIGAAL